MRNLHFSILVRQSMIDFLKIFFVESLSYTTFFKKWMRTLPPCTPASTSPEINKQAQPNPRPIHPYAEMHFTQGLKDSLTSGALNNTVCRIHTLKRSHSVNFFPN